MFKLYGYGCPTNYENALHWFEKASTSEDSDIAKRALKAHRELDELMAIAQHTNDGILDSLKDQSEEKVPTLRDGVLHS